MLSFAGPAYLFHILGYETIHGSSIPFILKACTTSTSAIVHQESAIDGFVHLHPETAKPWFTTLRRFPRFLKMKSKCRSRVNTASVRHYTNDFFQLLLTGGIPFRQSLGCSRGIAGLKEPSSRHLRA
jgi:hypothetical protein